MNLVELKIISIPENIYSFNWSRFKLDIRKHKAVGEPIHVFITSSGSTWSPCGCKLLTEKDIFNHGMECVSSYGQAIVYQTHQSFEFISPVSLSFLTGWRLC